MVWSALSLHHSRYQAKKAVVGEIRRSLVPGGVFLLYENTMRGGEGRDEWLARWDLQRSAWAAYDDANWDTVRDHVRAVRRK